MKYMENLLIYLAERKYFFYRLLYVCDGGNAKSEKECFDRISNLGKYEEILNIIRNLPSEEYDIVSAKFDELKLDFE